MKGNICLLTSCTSPGHLLSDSSTVFQHQHLQEYDSSKILHQKKEQTDFRWARLVSLHRLAVAGIKVVKLTQAAAADK